jgi:fructose-specific component phosphotransferase system IIB-like protein
MIMKKIKAPLKLTKTTVRVLQDADLAVVRGGIIPNNPSKNPTACAAEDYLLADGQTL